MENLRMETMEAIDKVVNYMYELGIKVDIENSFESRFKLQKITYLMHKFLDTYPFQPYLHGPYSPALTRDYFKPENIEKFKEGKTDANLEEKEKVAIEKLKKIILKMSNQQLEAMAMAYYLLDNNFADWSDITEKLKEAKPGIKYEDVIIGINNLKLWLVTEKQWKDAINDLKEENDFWEKASEISLNN